MIYTLQEVADILKCSYSTAYKLVRDKTIKSFRVGADFRVRKQDLDAFMAGE
jgi:excisionase family DNA binding protein